MKRTDRQLEAMLERLADALPKAVEPQRDLWPGIQARLDADGDRAVDIAGLPREIEPDHDLWPGIAARLEETSARRWGPALAFPRFGLAAAAGLLTVVATLVAFSVRMEDLSETAPIAATSVDAAWWFDELSASLARDPSGPVGAAFADASRSLYRDYELVREQRLAIEAAMTEAPSDASLRSLWRHAYKTELELIDRAHRLDTDYRRRIES